MGSNVPHYMAVNLERQFDSSKTRAGRVEVVYPWVDTEKIRPIPKQENWFAQKHGQTGKLTVMYSGNMGLGHDLEAMVVAARQLSASDVVHFMFVGAGPKWTWIDEMTHRDRLENVTLLPWQSEETLPWLQATADVALASLEPDMAGMAIPSKAIYALAAGAALLVLADEKSELAKWRTAYEFGPRVTSGTLGQVLLDYLNDPDLLHSHRQNARSAAISAFSRIKNTQCMLHKLNCAFVERTVVA